MASARPFRAFVSYCHADRAFAAWLQRRLESYRLPRRLADRVAPLPGQAPGRIGPVFRDRADLSAAQDLSAAVREAIALSSALIVVASPDAARSRWVEQEIQLFRELHPGAPILVALVKGEPGEALPDALRIGGAEPLAADFRKQGDGKRLAFLKIVAGLANLPLDTLVQRDAQRQLRRVTAVTLGAVILVVIMALLLAMALQAREEAERRRAAAEGLVEFMLTDLRDRLEGVGRLDVMATVNQRAMAYYSELSDLERVTDESLRAQVLHRTGQVEERRGNYGAALSNFSEASAITAAVLARKPRSANAIFAHGQSEFFVGLIAWRQSDRSAATRHWREYRRYSKALSEVEPDSVRSLMEQAYSEGNLCELDLKDNFDLKAAERQCTASIKFAQAAVDQSPGNRPLVVALANRIGWLARVKIEQRQYRAAIRSRETEGSLMDQLLRLDPYNIEYVLRRSWSDIGIAIALLALDEPARVLALLDRSLARAGKAFSLNGEDKRVTETMFRAELLLAKARQLTGKGFAANLARADQLEAALAGAGVESRERAKGIRASIWPQQGEAQ